jgi:hypothetical protein
MLGNRISTKQPYGAPHGEADRLNAGCHQLVVITGYLFLHDVTLATVRTVKTSDGETDLSKRKQLCRAAWLRRFLCPVKEHRGE